MGVFIFIFLLVFSGVFLWLKIMKSNNGEGREKGVGVRSSTTVVGIS